MTVYSNEREMKLQEIIELEKVLNDIQDIDVLLERILTESRRIVNADAGSIYVIEDNRLKIKYAQNDTKQRRLAPGQKLPFKYFSFEINEKSMCGSAVVTKSLLNVPDVYDIPSDKPYSFDRNPDMLTGYHSKSICTIPLMEGKGNVIGVLQIINPQDKDGNITSFNSDAELFLTRFAATAAQALVRAKLTREMVMRMVEMAGFRDPKETGSHVNRVASFSVEIYDHWAFDHKIDKEEASKYRDSLRIAAMLHDVGKVGISDLILKKPGKFTDEEYGVIKCHTLIGSLLFKNDASEIDRMAMDVALHHHERWDGNGYPGKVDTTTFELSNPEIHSLGSMSGEEIPLSARIVSVADVFDALSSARVYKEAWSREKVLTEMESQAGKQFDPAVIKAFFDALPMITEIQRDLTDVPVSA
ncbi:MAG: GAF domain-containing protein [Treponema sp.]|nr:GAF domain-containing protein [Candidatus Treponema caballi]